MIKSSLSHGMVPSDILIRTAIIAGIEDLRKNPFLLDFCFNWMANDDLTVRVYGDKEKERAKNWFLNTEIYVSMNFRMDDIKFPLISIALQASTEDLSTLGDVNYDTQEDVPTEEITTSPSVILGPFTPQQYDQSTGLITLPSSLSTETLFANNILVDISNNEGYVIREIVNDSSFKIDTDISANFTNAYIAPVDSFYVAQLESCLYKQVFSIKCFAQSEAVYALYLNTILEFILKRYNELLLEGRGFDRSTTATGPLYLYQESENSKQVIFGRDTTLTGYCRQYWPKLISPKIQGIRIHGIEIIGGTTTPTDLLVNVNNQGWGMPGDFDTIDELGIK